MITIDTFVAILDLGGTFVFAISGALAAVNRRLDIFGILVLSFVAGNFGGIARDVLIGAVPPAALSDGRYLLVSFLAGLRHLLLVCRRRPAAQSCASVRRSRPCVLRSRRCAKSDHVRVKSSNGRSSGHVDRHWRRHDARHPPHRDPASAAVRSIRRCSAGRRVHRRHRRYARSSLWSLSSGRRYPVLWSPLHGNHTWLAFAYRSSFCTKARGSRPFERREIALKLSFIARGDWGWKPANRRNTGATRDPCFCIRRHCHHGAWL